MTEVFDLTKDQAQRAADLHQKAIVIDAAVGSNVLEYPKDIERILEGGLTAGCHTIASWQHDFLAALRRIDRTSQLVTNDPRLFLAKSVKDVKEAKETGKHAVLLFFQDTRPVEDNLRNLSIFRELGVKTIQLTYNNQNLVGTGCCERSYTGLSNFGIKVVEEMNRLGIVVDVSHSADETTMDAINFSKDPILFSHSSVRALCNAYGRNKTDDQIKALAEKGGVIGICWQPFMLKRNKATHEVQSCTVEDLLNHIDYVVNLVGVDHVGFGSDLADHVQDEKITPSHSSLRIWRPLRPDVFGAGSTEVYDSFPEGLARSSEAPNITRGLVSRGYSDQEIFKILGENFLRIYETVWK